MVSSHVRSVVLAGACGALCLAALAGCVFFPQQGPAEPMKHVVHVTDPGNVELLFPSWGLLNV